MGTLLARLGTTISMKPISHSRPTLGREEFVALRAVFERREIALGRDVERFEGALAKYIGREAAVATNSGTSALHLALLALGIGAGDEVVIPSSVCPALLNAINYLSAKPVACDTNDYDLNINVDSLRQVISRRTKAIIVPHMLGIPADIQEILKLKIPVIEDCAQSLGAYYQGKPTGSFGVLSIFSFYATKMITSVDGGMVLTDRKDWLKKMGDLRYYGGKRNYKVRFNYKMQNIQAALGYEQLKKIKKFLRQREDITRKYDTFFAHFASIQRQRYAQNKKPSFYRYVVKLPRRVSLKRVYTQFKNSRIMADNEIIFPLHRYYPSTKTNYRNVEQWYRRCLSLPIYPSLQEHEVKYILKKTEKILNSENII